MSYRVAALLIVIASVGVAQTYTNGPLVSHPGGGFGGADASAITAPGTTFGYTSSPVFRLTDDFTVPCGQNWTLTTITSYGYQTQTVPSTISTLTGGNYRIWNGMPGSAGATILHDHSAASQMTSTTFTNIYRVTATTLATNLRPIMDCAMNGNAIVLGPGTYWLDYQVTGLLGTVATVFTPPVTILGQPTTGNGTAAQFNGTAWTTALVDANNLQSVPFKIDYTSNPLPCMTYDITQAGPAGPVTLANFNGNPGNSYLNVITLNAGGFPNGWLFGVDVSLLELANLLSGGPIFTGTLDFAGNFIIPSIPVAGAFPVPLPVYYVGIEFTGSGVVHADAAKTITIIP
jgi:hypothetical protein